MPPIDWNYLKDGVERFNQNGCDVAADTALHQATGQELTKETIPLIVYSVNWFWRTQVEMKACTLAFYCELLNIQLSEIAARAKFFRDYPLPVYSDDLLQSIISPAQELVLRLLGRPNGRRNFSFATKLLFWLTGLPPFDAKVANAVQILTGQNLHPPENPNDDQISNSYAQLIRLYNDELKGLEQNHRTQDLIELDFQTQPAYLRRRNNPVRIIDKYLWLTGRR